MGKLPVATKEGPLIGLVSGRRRRYSPFAVAESDHGRGERSMVETSQSSTAPLSPSDEERLESGEVLFHPVAPFALPNEDDRAFLFEQRLRGRAHKHITWNPHTGESAGFASAGGDQAERLSRVLADFSRGVAAWLAEALPRYRGACEPDRASFRPEEEATRRLRPNARNDLLHVDAFPTRPARGRRILRVYANLNPHEPRVWVTSEPLPRLLERFAGRIERRRGFWRQLGSSVVDWLRPAGERRLPTDVFMQQLHDYLKRSVKFQGRGLKRLWKFPPGSAWLAMTDGCCHAELRGRFALEHSFVIAPQALIRPDLAPAALIRAA
jgi:hypothetical protein